ncbi:hypothetical protein AHAS_Ahas15G0087100 [Arachis hypogaea]
MAIKNVSSLFGEANSRRHMISFFFSDHCQESSSRASTWSILEAIKEPITLSRKEVLKSP